MSDGNTNTLFHGYALHKQSTTSLNTHMSTRRTLIRLLLLVFVVSAFIWTFGSHLPESWKDTGILAYPLSRANILRAQKQTNELYGLLYLVTTDSEENQHILADRVDLDPSEPIALEVYAAGNKALDWTAKTEEINSKYPVIVFSKVRLRFKIGRVPSLF